MTATAEWSGINALRNISKTWSMTAGSRSRVYTVRFSPAASRKSFGSARTCAGCCVMSENAFTLNVKCAGVRSTHSAAFFSDGSA